MWPAVKSLVCRHTTQHQKRDPDEEAGDLPWGRWESTVWSGNTAPFDLVIDATQVLAAALG
jgi:hypothetical protein